MCELWLDKNFSRFEAHEVEVCRATEGVRGSQERRERGVPGQLRGL